MRTRKFWFAVGRRIRIVTTDNPEEPKLLFDKSRSSGWEEERGTSIPTEMYTPNILAIVATTSLQLYQMEGPRSVVG
jgi:hypothetical protein